MLRVCVFCGSKSGDRAEYAESAEQLGRWLARGGHTLIYGGGSTGIMGLLAEAVTHPDDHAWVTYRLRANARWHSMRWSANDVL